MSKGKRASNKPVCGLGGLLSPKLFKALSDPKRLSLLRRLLEEGVPCTVGTVAQGSGVDLSVVSRHLSVLREAGIVRCEKRGKEVYCAVSVDTVVKYLRELADGLESCCPDGPSLFSPRPSASGAAPRGARRAR